MTSAGARIAALLPALILLGALFGGGQLFAVVESLRGADGFTVEPYRALLSDAEFRVSVLHTTVLASIATLLSAIAGLALAVGLRELASRNRLLHTLVQVPIAVPHLAVAALMLDLLSQSGWIARLGYQLGFIAQPAEFPELLQDASGAGIVAAYVIKETPFLAVVVLAMLRRSVADYEALAATLGASPWQRFRLVTLPMVAPALVSASLLVFAFVFGAFETPFLLGRPYPAMLGVLVQRRYLSTDLNDRPEAIAAGMLMSMVCALIVLAYLHLSARLAGERPALF